MTRTRIGAAVLLTVKTASALHVASAQQPGVTRTDLQQHDLSVPGCEVIQVRVELAPGVLFPKHTHSGDEIVYVLEGSLEYQVEGQAPVIPKAGEVLFVPAGAIHTAKNVGRGSGAELATYSSTKANRSCRWLSALEKEVA